MGLKNNTMWARIKAWFLVKWKWVIGIFAGILAISIALVKRDTFWKENFKNLKDTTGKEKKIVEAASEKLTSGIEEINKKSEEDKKKIVEEKDKAREELEGRKKEFLEDSKKSDTLAEDIAKELGVNFVDSE